MKRDRVQKILECLEVGVSCLEDFYIIFTAPYGTSLGQIQYRILKKNLDQSERIGSRKRTRDHEKKKRIAEALSRLKRDGFISSVKTPDGTIYRLMEKGKEKLNALRFFRPPSYEIEKKSTATIIAYDIPEREKKKRRWLRLTLLHLQFEMLQKSVWIGKTKLPKEFIDDLVRLNIFQHVDILEITKRGSVKKM